MLRYFYTCKTGKLAQLRRHVGLCFSYLLPRSLSPVVACTTFDVACLICQFVLACNICVSIHVCIYIHIYIYIHIHPYSCTRARTHTYEYTHTHIHICLHICTEGRWLIHCGKLAASSISVSHGPLQDVVGSFRSHSQSWSFAVSGGHHCQHTPAGLDKSRQAQLEHNLAGMQVQARGVC